MEDRGNEDADTCNTDQLTTSFQSIGYCYEFFGGVYVMNECTSEMTVGWTAAYSDDDCSTMVTAPPTMDTTTTTTTAYPTPDYTPVPTMPPQILCAEYTGCEGAGGDSAAPKQTALLAAAAAVVMAAAAL